jgi:hypothetical protein
MEIKIGEKVPKWVLDGRVASPYNAGYYFSMLNVYELDEDSELNLTKTHEEVRL